MLVRISDKYIVNADRVLSAQIIPNKPRYILHVNFESETGEITRDAVSFSTYDEAESALEKILKSSSEKD